MEHTESSKPQRPSPMERMIEQVLFASRWLLVPLYAGLALVLLMIVVAFFGELWHAVTELRTSDESSVVISALSLVDIVLLANLVLMVMLSGYENVVSRLDVDNADRPAWLRKLDTSGLKLKLFGSLVAISGIQVLRQFMDLQHPLQGVDLDARRASLGWMLATHLAFVITGLLIALADRLAHGGRSDAGHR